MSSIIDVITTVSHDNSYIWHEVLNCNTWQQLYMASIIEQCHMTTVIYYVNYWCNNNSVTWQQLYLAWSIEL